MRENERKSLVIGFQNRLKNEIGQNDHQYRSNRRIYHWVLKPDLLEDDQPFWKEKRIKTISSRLKKRTNNPKHTSSSSEKEERTKEGIKNTLCEYGCVISRERHTHTERARTWYIYVVYKPLFSRTFVFFRTRNFMSCSDEKKIFVVLLILRRKSLCCWISDLMFFWWKALKCLTAPFWFFLTTVWPLDEERDILRAILLCFVGNFALCCGQMCWLTQGAEA